MSNLQAEEYKSFEAIKKIRENGTEYWSARELSEVLEYKQWRNFAKVIDRAKIACQNSGRIIDDDFAEVSKIVEAKQWNQMLLEVAHNAGVITNQEYAKFQNAGYMGLYGGLTVDDIHKKKNLKDNEKILDFMGSEELAANLFRITQTEAKLKRENIKTKEKANKTHYVVGTTVRKAIKDIGGTMPEDLPTPEKSIKQVEREQLKRLKNRKTKLMLDE